MDVELSVVMPVYNAARYLKESIESILSQTFTQFEFIIINDGSTDDTERVILGYNDDRISYSKIPENKGVVFCLNHGMSIAKGSYIARMDADDIAHPQRLFLQHSFLEKNMPVQVVGSFTRLFSESGPGKIRKYPTQNAAIKCMALKETPFAHPSVMFRNSLVKNGDYYYDELFYPAEDYELWTRLILKHKTANIALPLLNYRMHHEQISFVKRQAQLEINTLLKTNYVRCFLKISDDAVIKKCFNFYNEPLVAGVKKSGKLFLFLVRRAVVFKNFYLFKLTVFIFFKSRYKTIMAFFGL